MPESSSPCFKVPQEDIVLNNFARRYVHPRTALDKCVPCESVFRLSPNNITVVQWAALIQLVQAWNHAINPKSNIFFLHIMAPWNYYWFFALSRGIWAVLFLLVLGIEIYNNHIALNYFTFHPVKYNHLWHVIGWSRASLGKVHETRSNMRTVTCCRRWGLYPQIHCDKPFHLFRGEMPKDTPPPSFHIMAKNLTWFRSGPLQLSYCTVH